MKITICGSMTFHSQMREVKAKLETMGYTVYVPKGIELMDKFGYEVPAEEGERVEHKIEHDFIREHFRKVDNSDVILVLNYSKKEIDNYIGGNTFLEMGYAFGTDKKIYLLNPVPQMEYSTEMLAMEPVILNGDLTKIS